MKKLQKMRKILYMDEEDFVSESLTSENRIVVTEQKKALEKIDRLLRESNV